MSAGDAPHGILVHCAYSSSSCGNYRTPDRVGAASSKPEQSPWFSLKDAGSWPDDMLGYEAAEMARRGEGRLAANAKRSTLFLA